MSEQAYRCDRCGKNVDDMMDLGYYGPGERGDPDPDNTECSPFMEWLRLCHACLEQHHKEHEKEET